MTLRDVEGTSERLEALLVVLALELDDPQTVTPLAALAGQYRATVLAIEALPAKERSLLDDIDDDLAVARAARARRVSVADVVGPPGGAFDVEG